MGDLMSRIEQAHTAEELFVVLSLLSSHVKHWGGAGTADPVGCREARNCLARIRLVVRELEWREVRSQGASRTMAERYAELESAVHAVTHDLDVAMRRTM